MIDDASTEFDVADCDTRAVLGLVGIIGLNGLSLGLGTICEEGRDPPCESTF